jgi:hypothetical protein
MFVLALPPIVPFRRASRRHRLSGRGSAERTIEAHGKFLFVFYVDAGTLSPNTPFEEQTLFQSRARIDTCMRALMRIEIVDPKRQLPSRNDRDQYDAAVVALLKEIGYDARQLSSTATTLPSQAELEQWEEVKRLFEGVPNNVLLEETKHLVMLGYTSEGQAKFVVCSINQRIIHIRVRDDLFDKLRRACREICTSIWKHAAHMHRTFGKRPSYLYLRVNGPVEVIEPGHGHATILGHLIKSPLRELIKTYPRESSLAVITLLTSLILFWITPDFAPVLTKWLQRIKDFQISYIQGALERTYSAILVTFFLTIVDLAIKFRQLWIGRPIIWNAGIEPSRPQPTT